MPGNTAESMFGGAGVAGSRPSAGSLDGLRNIMRNEQEKSSPVNPDDEETTRGLNDRLSGYLDKAHKLESDNKALEEKINDILTKRSAPDGRNLDEIEKPLTDLKKKLKEMAMENARILLQIENNKLANDDFKTKLDAETQACRTVEHDLNNARKIAEDTQLNRLGLESQVKSVEEELAMLQTAHKDEVEALRSEIRDSSTIMQVDAPASNRSEPIGEIRARYEKQAEKALKETEDRYRSKFEKLRVEVVRNTEVVQSGQAELNELRRKRRQLEVDIEAMLNMIRYLEEALKDLQGHFNTELSCLNRILMGAEAKLTQMRARMEHQSQEYQYLSNVKMNLEAEISKYQQLICNCSDVTAAARDKRA